MDPRAGVAVHVQVHEGITLGGQPPLDLDARARVQGGGGQADLVEAPRAEGGRVARPVHVRAQDQRQGVLGPLPHGRGRGREAAVHVEAHLTPVPHPRQVVPAVPHEGARRGRRLAVGAIHVDAPVHAVVAHEEPVLAALGLGQQAAPAGAVPGHVPALQGEVAAGGEVHLRGRDHGTGALAVEGEHLLTRREGGRGQAPQVHGELLRPHGQGEARALGEPVRLQRDLGQGEGAVEAPWAAHGAHGELGRLAGGHGALQVIGEEPPARIAAPDLGDQVHGPGRGVRPAQDEVPRTSAGGVPRRLGRHLEAEGARDPRGLRHDLVREGARIGRAADGVAGHRDAVVAHVHELVVVEPAGGGHGAPLVAAHRGQGEVLDAVPRAVVAHVVDVPAEDGADVAGRRQEPVDLLPVVAVAPPGPARVVDEREHVARVLRALEGRGEPRQLGLAHALALGLREVPLAGLRVGLVGVEHEEPAALVLDRVPQGAEVLLVVGLVLLRGPALAAPVDVVVARDRVPRAVEGGHRRAVLAHLLHPLGRLVVAVDQVTDRHHQVGVDQVHLGHRVGQDLDALGRPARAVAEDREQEAVLLAGELGGPGARSVGQDPGAVRALGQPDGGRGSSGQRGSGGGEQDGERAAGSQRGGGGQHGASLAPLAAEPGPRTVKPLWSAPAAGRAPAPGGGPGRAGPGAGRP